MGRMSRQAPGFSSATSAEVDQARQAAQTAFDERTEDRKGEIIKMMQEAKERHEELKACGLAEERRGINRADVEELLDVSKPTALSYLNELEEEGKIVQIGQVGRGTYYRLLK